MLVLFVFFQIKGTFVLVHFNSPLLTISTERDVTYLSLGFNVRASMQNNIIWRLMGLWFGHYHPSRLLIDVRLYDECRKNNMRVLVYF